MGKHRKISIGQKFGRLKVDKCLGVQQWGKRKFTIYSCICECGKKANYPGTQLGTVYNICGCLQAESREKVIPSGAKYGKLIVIGKLDKKKYNCFLYSCQCQCKDKNIIEVRSDQLKSGEVKSCGCLHDELFESYKKENYKKMYI